MAKRSIVPFGPQHPVFPEPVHLDLVLEDEVVVGAVPSIGFVHRGLEKLVETKDYKEYIYIYKNINNKNINIHYSSNINKKEMHINKNKHKLI